MSQVVSYKENIPGREDSTCKGPEVGGSLACAGTSRGPVSHPGCHAEWSVGQGQRQRIHQEAVAAITPTLMKLGPKGVGVVRRGQILALSGR